MPSIAESHPPLRVTIIGAGITGCALAISLSLPPHNHTVTLLERHSSLNIRGSSIQILPNGVRPLKAWGLEPLLDPFVARDRYLQIHNGFTNEKLGHNPFNVDNFADINWGGELWGIHRKDYLDILAKAATDAGAKIIFNSEVNEDGIYTDTDNKGNECVTVKTIKGDTYTGDLVVGADGIRSNVRRSIPALADITPQVFAEKYWRVSVPKDRMRGNPVLEPLLTSHDQYVWTAPGRYVIAWPLADSTPFDVLVAREGTSDLPPGKWGITGSPTEALDNADGFCPTVIELLRQADSCVKWITGDVPPLDTCRSPNGRIVLLGDAWHAMLPHAGCGGNSAIEDAACLTECLDWAVTQTSKKEMPLSTALAKATQAFEDIRKPRVHRMQAASHEGVGFMSAQGDFVQIRDEALKQGTAYYDSQLRLSEEERRALPRAEPDINARFPLEGFLQWIYRYDAIDEARKYLATYE